MTERNKENDINDDEIISSENFFIELVYITKYDIVFIHYLVF